MNDCDDNGNKTFVRINNQQIWEKLCKIHDDLIGVKEKVRTHDKLIWGVLVIIVLWIVKFIMMDSPTLVQRLVG